MQWKCTVCNFIHTGDSPPDSCPVCGASSDAFAQIDAIKKADVPKETSTAKHKGPPPSAIGSKGADATSNREWRCTVCNYIHRDDSPPDVCPVCKKSWSAFIPNVEGLDGPRLTQAEPHASANTKSSISTTATSQKSDRWRCVVCNYIHESDAPPEICPICGAKQDAFVPEQKSPEHHHRGFSGFIEKLHLHPVSAHLPNGALPLAVVSWVAYLIWGDTCLERASLYLMLVSTAAVPFTGISGWSDAKHRFGTTQTGVFPTKKRLTWILGVLMTCTAAWRLFLGWNHVPAGMELILFSVLLIGAMGVAVRLGMLGGKLVFGH